MSRSKGVVLRLTRGFGRPRPHAAFYAEPVTDPAAARNGQDPQRRVAVLTHTGRPAAVTVRFRLGLLRQGETGNEVRERVSGDLYLTHQPGDGWRVFGYDVQRGAL